MTTSFLDLPREIRDQIYTIIFHCSHRIYPNRTRSGVSPYVGFLRTNKQIYEESIDILYGTNTFQIRGEPRWMSPEFLNLLGCQRRDGYATMGTRSVICLARHHLKRLYIPSHGISLDRLKHLLSLLKYFPVLEYLEVIFRGSLEIPDMEVVNICRLLRDRRPMLEGFVLRKRISYVAVEDISWMVLERPYRMWRSITDDGNRRHVWKNEDGVERRAQTVEVLQNIPE